MAAVDRVGDEVATGGSFEAAFDALFVRAFRLSYRILGDSGTAEDVAAETLARTFASWSKVATLPHRDGWVLRVATNLALDVVRRRRHAASLAPPHAAPPPGPERVALVAALKRLPRRQREVVALRHLSGLSEQEVAASLRLSVGSVKTHNHRALAALRSMLGDTMEEAPVGLV